MIQFSLPIMTEIEALDLLEIQKPFTSEALKKAYRQSLMVWHPDRFQDSELRERANRKTERINEAYKFLQRGSSQEKASSPQPPSNQGSSAPKSNKSLSKEEFARRFEAFLKSAGYSVVQPFEKRPIRFQIDELNLQMGALAARGLMVGVKYSGVMFCSMLMDGDTKGDDQIISMFDPVHDEMLLFRKYSRKHDLVGKLFWKMPNQTYGVGAQVYVAFSSSKRAVEFWGRCGSFCHKNSKSYGVETNLCVVDLEQRDCYRIEGPLSDFENQEIEGWTISKKAKEKIKERRGDEFRSLFHS